MEDTDCLCGTRLAQGARYCFDCGRAVGDETHIPDVDPRRPHVYVPDPHANYGCLYCGSSEYALKHILDDESMDFDPPMRRGVKPFGDAPRPPLAGLSADPTVEDLHRAVGGLYERWGYGMLSFVPYAPMRAYLWELYSRTDPSREYEYNGNFLRVNGRESELLHLTRHQMYELVQAVRSVAELSADVEAKPETLVELARRRISRSNLAPDVWRPTLDAVEEWLRVFGRLPADQLVQEAGDWRGIQLLVGPTVEGELEHSEVSPMPSNGEWEFVGDQMLGRTQDLMFQMAAIEALLNPPQAD